MSIPPGLQPEKNKARTFKILPTDSPYSYVKFTQLMLVSILSMMYPGHMRFQRTNVPDFIA